MEKKVEKIKLSNEELAKERKIYEELKREEIKYSYVS